MKIFCVCSVLSIRWFRISNSIFNNNGNNVFTSKITHKKLIMCTRAANRSNLILASLSGEEWPPQLSGPCKRSQITISADKEIFARLTHSYSRTHTHADVPRLTYWVLYRNLIHNFFSLNFVSFDEFFRGSGFGQNYAYPTGSGSRSATMGGAQCNEK